MRAKSTTAQGKEHEEDVVEILEVDQAWRSRSSGNSAHQPIDVTSDHFVIECESTEKKSYSLNLDFWQEIVEKQHSSKWPALAIRFRDPVDGQNTDLLVMSLHDVAELRELSWKNSL